VEDVPLIFPSSSLMEGPGFFPPPQALNEHTAAKIGGFFRSPRTTGFNSHAGTFDRFLTVGFFVGPTTRGCFSGIVFPVSFAFFFFDWSSKNVGSSRFFAVAQGAPTPKKYCVFCINGCPPPSSQRARFLYLAHEFWFLTRRRTQTDTHVYGNGGSLPTKPARAWSYLRHGICQMHFARRRSPPHHCLPHALLRVVVRSDFDGRVCCQDFF